MTEEKILFELAKTNSFDEKIDKMIEILNQSKKSDDVDFYESRIKNI